MAEITLFLKIFHPVSSFLSLFFYFPLLGMGICHIQSWSHGISKRIFVHGTRAAFMNKTKIFALKRLTE